MDLRGLNLIPQSNQKLIFHGNKMLNEDLYSYPLMNTMDGKKVTENISPDHMTNLKKGTFLNMLVSNIVPFSNTPSIPKTKMPAMSFPPTCNLLRRFSATIHETINPSVIVGVNFSNNTSSQSFQIAQKVMENLNKIMSVAKPCAEGISDFCKELNQSLSECSNDSDFIQFEESDLNETSILNCIWSDDDDSECDDEDESDCDDEIVYVEDERLAEAQTKWDSFYRDVDDTDNTVKRKVQFNPKPTVHMQYAWNYAHRAARVGNWEEMARDRCRFQDRVTRLSSVINPILTQSHRQKVWNRLHSVS